MVWYKTISQNNDVKKVQGLIKMAIIYSESFPKWLVGTIGVSPRLFHMRYSFDDRHFAGTKIKKTRYVDVCAVLIEIEINNLLIVTLTLGSVEQCTLLLSTDIFE